MKFFSAAILVKAALPASIDLCRYPFVFENTKTLLPLLEPVDSSLQDVRRIQLNKLNKINCFFILQALNVKGELKINAKNEMNHNELI